MLSQPPRSAPSHPRSASARWHARARQRDTARTRHAVRARSPCARHPAARRRARPDAACRRPRRPASRQDDSTCRRWRRVPAGHPASRACRSRRLRSSSSPPKALRIGASARLTTLIVMRKRTIAIAVPIWSWVMIPSQISAISSFGCDVISERTRLSLDRDRHVHRGLFGVNERDEPCRRRACIGIAAQWRRRPRISAASPCRVMLTWRSRLRSSTIWFSRASGSGASFSPATIVSMNSRASRMTL